MVGGEACTVVGWVGLSFSHVVMAWQSKPKGRPKGKPNGGSSPRFASSETGSCRGFPFASRPRLRSASAMLSHTGRLVPGWNGKLGADGCRPRLVASCRLLAKASLGFGNAFANRETRACLHRGNSGPMAADLVSSTPVCSPYGLLHGGAPFVNINYFELNN